MSGGSFKMPIQDKWKKYWFDTHPPDIAEYSWNYLFTGGKEIRSRLFCDLWSYLSPDSLKDAQSSLSSESAQELAFAIECIHVASLILDDSPWMDNAQTRRGKTTLHIVFSEKKALLLCHDVMYIAYLIWSENKPAHIDKKTWESFMVHKLQRLMMGQWYDLEKKGSLVELASLKTGVLFELATETVARCLSLDADFWRQWGNHLGVLFQWTDDWLDREEDIAQGNRNAFNEAPEHTLQQYGQIWQKIMQSIGPSWFQTPFGSFMKTYFTQHVSTNSSTSLETAPLSTLWLPYSTMAFPTITKQEVIHSPLSGKGMIKQMIFLSTHLMMHKDEYEPKYKEKYISFKQQLWSMKEEEWEPACMKWKDEFQWAE